MAVLSDRHSYLFIMAPRTGCTALSLRLVEYMGGRWFPEEDVTDDDGRVVAERKHSTVQHLLDAGMLTESRAASLFVFASVRNPFDSLVSLYTKLTNQYVPLLDDPDAFIHRQPNMLADIRYASDHSFSDWIVWKYGELAAGPGRHLYEPFIKSADRIMRFERLQEDFDEVVWHLGIAADSSIPVFNVTEGRVDDYRDLYNTRARQTVERAFEDDLTLFGYEF